MSVEAVRSKQPRDFDSAAMNSKRRHGVRIAKTGYVFHLCILRTVVSAEQPLNGLWPVA
jgi:hypothetical protein